jgi:activating signal cointegrator complex subunit 3
LRKEFDEPQIEKIYQVIKDLPTINVEIKIRGRLKDQNDFEQIIKQPLVLKNWIEIHSNEEYQLAIHLHRQGQRSNPYIYSRFPKPKDEGWFLTLGSQENGELFALRRVSMKSNQSTNYLVFNAPSILGRCIYTLYFVSDCYIGLDQQFNLQFVVTESPREKLGRMHCDDVDKY